jgi:voltage-gated potassium channel
MGKSMSAHRYSFLEAEPGEVSTNLAYELFIQVVTLIALFLLVGIYILPLPVEVVQVFVTVDTMVSLIFFIDFLRSLRLARNKASYMLRGGWLDLLGSLPGQPIFRLLRIFRMYRSWRRIRQNTSQEILAQAREKLAESSLFIVFLVILVVITLGSSLVVLAESASPEANIQTGYEAVWWAFVTMATVGYGDYTPVTDPGRTVAVFVMITGVGFFGVLSSFLASTFITNRRKRDQDELAGIKSELALIRGLLEERQAETPGAEISSQPEDSNTQVRP